MLKRGMALCAAATLALSMAACGGKTSNKTTTGSSTKTSSSSTTVKNNFKLKNLLKNINQETLCYIKTLRLII